MSKLLNNPNYNIIAIIIAEIIGCTITFSIDYSETEMTSIIMKWIPALIGLATLFIYFVSRLITKKYNWIISIIGIVIIFITVNNLFSTDYSQTL